MFGMIRYRIQHWLFRCASMRMDPANSWNRVVLNTKSKVPDWWYRVFAHQIMGYNPMPIDGTVKPLS